MESNEMNICQYYLSETTCILVVWNLKEYKTCLQILSTAFASLISNMCYSDYCLYYGFVTHDHLLTSSQSQLWLSDWFPSL